MVVGRLANGSAGAAGAAGPAGGANGSTGPGGGGGTASGSAGGGGADGSTGAGGGGATAAAGSTGASAAGAGPGGGANGSGAGSGSAIANGLPNAEPPIRPTAIVAVTSLRIMRCGMRTPPVKSLNQSRTGWRAANAEEGLPMPDRCPVNGAELPGSSAAG